MKKLLLNISKLFWPELESFPHARQLVGVGDVFSSLYSTFIYGIGIYWLISETEFQLIINEWKILLFFFVLTSLLSRLTYFMIIEFREDRYGVSDGSFDSMMTWTNVFIFGAIGIWPIILDRSFTYLLNFRKGQTKQKKWDSYRNFSLTLAGFTIPYLVGLNIYSYYRGVFPIRNLDTNTLIASLLAIIINFITLIIIWLPYFMYSLSTQKALVGKTQTQPVFKFFLQAISIPTLAHPFSILISNIYVQNNLLVFLFLILGVIGVSYFAMQFSRVAEKSRQKSRQLEKLEQLGRAFLGAPPDISALSDILSKYIPNMFPSGNISIWIIPGQTIYQSPADWQKDFGPIWNWVDEQVTVNGILANTPLPWETNNDSHRPVICSPIMSHEGDQVIGGIYLELRQLSQSWDSDTLSDLYPGIQTLGDLISSAIHHSEEYARSIAYEKVDQEIQLAGQIQASFLPNQFPSIPGWQLAVTLEPAGGLSGDFFDFIPLSRGRLGFLVADVADKGLGAALYMALGRTLLRTYALEYHSRPDVVFSETNERILNDARANLFITCFYGILDPTNNSLMYCNAGHNPPILINPNTKDEYVSLDRTGMPIGIEEDTRWERKHLDFKPGDKLIVYTDGITEAQNSTDEFFEIEQLVATATSNANKSAYELQTTILTAIKEFTGDLPQQDDITLMILSKEQNNANGEEE